MRKDNVSYRTTITNISFYTGSSTDPNLHYNAQMFVLHPPRTHAYTHTHTHTHTHIYIYINIYIYIYRKRERERERERERLKIKQNKNSRLRVSRYWSLDELLFDTSVFCLIKLNRYLLIFIQLDKISIKCVHIYSAESNISQTDRIQPHLSIDNVKL